MPNPSQDVLWLRNRALASTNVSIAIADARVPDLPLLDVNPSFVKLTGYESKEAVGRNCRFLQGPRTDPATTKVLREAIKAETEAHVVILNHRKDGHAFWNEIILSPVFDQNGNTTHFVAAQMDVTSRVRGEESRQLLNDVDGVLSNRLNPVEVVQPVTEIVVARIADLCMIHLIDEAEEIHRSAVATAPALNANKQLRMAVEDEFAPETIPAIVKDCIASGRPLSNRHHLIRESRRTRGGSIGNVAYGVIVAPIVGPSRVFGAITFAMDDRMWPIEPNDEMLAAEIGHRMGNLFEMGRLYRELQAAIDVRDEFLSIAAHELRTPISSVKGYSQLLLRGLERGTLIPERLRLGLKTIETSASRLTTLTSDLLEVSRIGLNRIPLRVETVSAHEYISAFLDEHSTLKADPHEFILTSADPDIFIEIDISRLDQVLSNLASNAVKYSAPDKPVEISLSAESGGVAICVRDRGMGLEDEDVERIFQPFQRSKSAIASSIPGMGLGLFISRNIVERHGGTLTALSEGPGTGTTFRVWLPAADQAAADD
jgi:PAS domain S-box-containing protein